MIAMYDSVTPFLLPVATKYAGYVNGRYKNVATIQKLHPTARVFGIDVLGTDWENASILDCEAEDATSPAVIRAWVISRENFRPGTAVIYCDRDNLPFVEEVLEGLDYKVWISTLDKTDMTGTITAHGKTIVGTQTEDLGAYDVSSTLDEWK